jgi:ribosome-binding factor A
MTASSRPMPRRARVAEAMKSALSALLARDLKDPRVAGAMPVINHVELTRDLGVANIGVSFLVGDDRAIKAAMAGLEAAAGFLRGPLARSMSLQRAPELRFHHDRSQELASRLHDIVREDEARRREADGDDLASDVAAADDGETADDGGGVDDGDDEGGDGDGDTGQGDD